VVVVVMQVLCTACGPSCERERRQGVKLEDMTDAQKAAFGLMGADTEPWGFQVDRHHPVLQSEQDKGLMLVNALPEAQRLQAIIRTSKTGNDYVAEASRRAALRLDRARPTRPPPQSPGIPAPVQFVNPLEGPHNLGRRIPSQAGARDQQRAIS
jgi:hypothetical protein